MNRTEMIDAIRAGKPLNHRTLQAIADELESLGNHLRSSMIRIDEQEEQLRQMGRAFANARQRVVRMGVIERDLLARCDLLDRENNALVATLNKVGAVRDQALHALAVIHAATSEPDLQRFLVQ